jgi:hypothetical protein
MLFEHDNRMTKPAAVDRSHNDRLQICDPLSDKMSVFYTNARSLLPKLNHLYNYLEIYKPSIVAITETWLDESIPTSFFCPHNYVAYRNDRESSKGGGALLMVIEDIHCNSIDLSVGTFAKINAVACSLTLHNGKTLGCLCVYRPPNCTINEDNELYNNIKIYLNYNFDCNVLMGDFNFPDILWPYSATSTQSENFVIFCQDNFLQQHVSSSTRRKSNAILDLVLTTCGTHIFDLSINEELHNSDHSIIQFSVLLRPNASKRKSVRRNFRRLNNKKFEHLLSEFPDWPDLLSSKNIDLIWSRLLHHITAALDVVAPLRMISRRNFISSSKVRTALRHKRRCFKHLNLNPTLMNLTDYLKSVVIANNAVRNDSIYRENRILSNKEPKMFWSYVNRRLSHVNTTESISSDGLEIVDNREISNLFNKYFASNFTTSCGTDTRVVLPDKPSSGSDNTSLNSFSVTLCDLLKVLKTLPPKTSTDNDGLCYNILKSGGTTIANLLLDLFTLSLETCRIPTPWKNACVTPIYKDGSRKFVCNYRPISVTSCCSRILERLIRNQLTDFLMKNELIHFSQHGFQRGKSTDTALLNFYDYVTRANDDGMVVDAVFFDFSKAFDKVSHSILIDRLTAHRISGRALSWLSDFLINRFQKVKFGDSVSDAISVSSGIIQGSVLGPTLFNIFINNIDRSLKHCNILKYADDIRIFHSSQKDDTSLRELSIKIQCDIDNVAKWALDSSMAFNTNKCFVVNFGRSSPGRDYKIGNKLIPNKSVFRDLGISVSSPLSFNKHVDFVVAKAYSRLGLINKVFLLKTKKTILRLFKAFVRPLLEFSSVIWNPYTARNINKIERVQKRLCRMIPDIRQMCYRKQLETLNIFSLETRRLRFQLISVFKIYKQTCNIRFSDFFSLVKCKRTRGHSLALNTKHANTNYRLHFFTLSIIEIWNKLPQYVIDSPDLNTFKIGLASFFRNQNIR